MFNFFKKNTDTKAEGDQPKKSIYRRFQDAKRGELSEEDVLKYTGKSKDEIREWGKDRPGVAGNQAAGKLDMGGTSGLGGMATGEGYGGWGHGANAPPKFPPKSEAKKIDSEGED
ncbi:hypothetical protein OQA88_13165 [Cercophora sp. LCS_1]